jgi:hypothetical protein
MAAGHDLESRRVDHDGSLYHGVRMVLLSRRRPNCGTLRRRIGNYYIEGFYNTRRLHSTLEYRSPAVLSQIAGLRRCGSVTGSQVLTVAASVAEHSWQNYRTPRSLNSRTLRLIPYRLRVSPIAGA